MAAVALSSLSPVMVKPLTPNPLALIWEMFRLILLSSEESAPTCRLKSIALFMSAKVSILRLIVPPLFTEDTVLMSELLSRLIAAIRESMLVKAFLVPVLFASATFAGLVPAVAVSTR